MTLDGIYDRESALKAFEESKIGMKGLVDSGITKVPDIFIDENYRLEVVKSNVSSAKPSEVDDEIAVIDLTDLGTEDKKQREEIVKQIGSASRKHGCFQVVNHGIPASLLDEMIEGIRRFHEGDNEMKKAYYSRDFTSAERNVWYFSNHDIFPTKVGCWRDTLAFARSPSTAPDPHELPPACRDVMIKYTSEVTKLGDTIIELLSEALGLDRNHLKEIGVGQEGIYAPCQYYPPCPEPDLTLGTKSHIDSSFITILVQDHIGGLQTLHDGRWIDVISISGALVVNMGNLMQLISNDEFIAPPHRVVAKREGPRISMACLFRAHHFPENTKLRVYEPMKQLLSDKKPPIYRPVTTKEVVTNKYAKQPGVVRNSLGPFKLSPAM